jgi:hypothetical protein
VNRKNLARHKRRIHKSLPFSKNEKSILKWQQRSALNEGSQATGVPQKEICPKCHGDGGVHGGCYKCDGTGWLTIEKREAQTFVAPELGWHSRVSNASYQNSSVATSFRDTDGRFGSIPDHDDYSTKHLPEVESTIG